MPHVSITMRPGRDKETKQEIAQKVQAFLSEELSLDPKHISVSIEDVPKERWAAEMKKVPDHAMYIPPGA